jgi:hypothetical protein
MAKKNNPYQKEAYAEYLALGYGFLEMTGRDEKRPNIG